MCNMEQETKTTPAVEVWHPVVGYEGLYEVSNKGVVRSTDRTINNHPYPGKVLAIKYLKGYAAVHLCDHQHRVKHKTIHRIVAEAFIPNPDNLPEVNHKDENIKNNCVENLEWCTQIYNIRYGTGIERRATFKRKRISKFTKSGEFVASFVSVFEASKSVGKGRKGTGLISTAARDIRKSAYGFVWKYVDN